MHPLRLLGIAAALALGPAVPATAAATHRHKDVKVQLLAINDFHGNLQPTTTGGIRPPTPAGQTTPPAARQAGGAAYLARYVRRRERTNRNSLVVAAGDLIGGSPLLSALYHDEPTIEAMNLIGLDLASVGNHEFDEGAAELKRMQRGGCHPKDGCKDGNGFAGAKFRYLSANVVRKRSGRPFFPPYAIRRFQGRKIGFSGMRLGGTPGSGSPWGIGTRRILDGAAPATRYARRLKRRPHVKAIGVLLH